jgi:hypothetical protein
MEQNGARYNSSRGWGKIELGAHRHGRTLHSSEEIHLRSRALTHNGRALRAERNRHEAKSVS